ncbi:MAG: methyltransferase domain-containing protein [Betaproteobacteria bacterium]|nr:methyltransferase domain-containing protein [Betaproteobacteria bacterium]
MSSIPLAAPRASAARLSRFSALAWPLESLYAQAHWRAPHYGITQAAKSRRLSFRMLRYWYMERLVAREALLCDRALRVLEVGVDRGQMKSFVDHAPAPACYAAWDAADIAPQQEVLHAAGYARCIPLDLEDEPALEAFAAAHAGQYDVLIVLHLLEHLADPHAAFRVLARVVRPGGVALGGYPSLPDWLRHMRERQLRASAMPHGHVSAFSPGRTRQMADAAGLSVEWMAGAFALRASGSPLEDQAWWLRANAAFGALLRGWPGELYWQMRKP